MKSTVFASIVVLALGASAVLAVSYAWYRFHGVSPAEAKSDLVSSAPGSVHVDWPRSPEANDAYWIESISKAVVVRRRHPIGDTIGDMPDSDPHAAVPGELVELIEKLYDLGAREVWFRERNQSIELITRLPPDPLSRHAVIDGLVAVADPTMLRTHREWGVGWEFYGVTLKLPRPGRSGDRLPEK